MSLSLRHDKADAIILSGIYFLTRGSLIFQASPPGHSSVSALLVIPALECSFLARFFLPLSLRFVRNQSFVNCRHVWMLIGQQCIHASIYLRKCIPLRFKLLIVFLFAIKGWYSQRFPMATHILNISIFLLTITHPGSSSILL
jgi:hypothetical protein